MMPFAGPREHPNEDQRRTQSMAMEMPRLGVPAMWQSGLMSPDVEFPRPGAVPLPGPESDDDVALMRRVQERDERAVEELVRRFERPLYSLAYRVAGSDRFAQEVVQEVFVTVWRDADRYDPARGAVSSWLLTITRFKAIDMLRREAGAKRRHVDVDLTFEPSDHNVHEETWLRTRRETVRAALRELSATQREAVTMAFLDGLTHVEVAEALAIPLGTAKTRIRNGLIRLRKVLGESLSESVPASNGAGQER